MQDVNRFADKRIAVVGASSGIGRQIAVTLSAAGATLMLIARREEMLLETKKLLNGQGHQHLCADMAELETIGDVFQTVKERFGPLDGLVYCVGVNSTVPLHLLKPEKLQEIFRINFFGFTEVVRQATRRGRYREGMRIVAISSNAAIRGDKAHTAYSASKAAMNAAVRCMAKELADKQIAVNAVAPAMTNTELFRQYSALSGGADGGEQDLLKRQYLGIIEPADVADAVAFLLSLQARMITGITLPVDGGLSSN